MRLWLDSMILDRGQTLLVEDVAADTGGAVVVRGSGPGLALLREVQEEVAASGLTLATMSPMARQFNSMVLHAALGICNRESWDMLWTKDRICWLARASGAMQPGQAANCYPGTGSLTNKAGLVATLQSVYGDLPGFFPRSFALPHQMNAWRAWVTHARLPSNTLWVLKANKHNAAGVRVLPQDEALQEALRVEGRQPVYLLAQAFLADQVVHEGWPCFLRTFYIITSHQPLRLYAYRGGNVLCKDFAGTAKHVAAVDATAARRPTASHRQRRMHGAHPKAAAGAAVGSGWVESGRLPRRGLLHTGNFFRISMVEMTELVNANTLIQVDMSTSEASDASDPAAWGTTAASRRRLTPFGVVWRRMQRVAGLAVAAGISSMHHAAEMTSYEHDTGFKILGIDFVLNATGHPTLLEVNADPSLARSKDAGWANAANATSQELFSLLVTPAGTRMRAVCPTNSSKYLPPEGSSASLRVEEGTYGSTGGFDSSLGHPGIDRDKERLLHSVLRLMGASPRVPPPSAAQWGQLQVQLYEQPQQQAQPFGSARVGSGAAPAAASAALQLGGVLRAASGMVAQQQRQLAGGRSAAPQTPSGAWGAWRHLKPTASEAAAATALLNQLRSSGYICGTNISGAGTPASRRRLRQAAPSSNDVGDAESQGIGPGPCADATVLRAVAAGEAELQLVMPLAAGVAGAGAGGLLLPLDLVLPSREAHELNLQALQAAAAAPFANVSALAASLLAEHLHSSSSMEASRNRSGQQRLGTARRRRPPSSFWEEVPSADMANVDPATGRTYAHAWLPLPDLLDHVWTGWVQAGRAAECVVAAGTSGRGASGDEAADLGVCVARFLARVLDGLLLPRPGR